MKWVVLEVRYVSTSVPNLLLFIYLIFLIKQFFNLLVEKRKWREREEKASEKTESYKSIVHIY